VVFVLLLLFVVTMVSLARGGSVVSVPFLIAVICKRIPPERRRSSSPSKPKPRGLGILKPGAGGIGLGITVTGGGGMTGGIGIGTGGMGGIMGGIIGGMGKIGTIGTTLAGRSFTSGSRSRSGRSGSSGNNIFSGRRERPVKSFGETNSPFAFIFSSKTANAFREDRFRWMVPAGTPDCASAKRYSSICLGS
jgi:hypothetical protein